MLSFAAYRATPHPAANICQPAMRENKIINFTFFCFLYCTLMTSIQMIQTHITTKHEPKKKRETKQEEYFFAPH
jgi:hypothetical protein